MGKVASVANITFPDYDLDLHDLGGILSWLAPMDTSQVTHYIIYFARASCPVGPDGNIMTRVRQLSSSDVDNTNSTTTITTNVTTTTTPNVTDCANNFALTYFGNTTVGTDNITVLPDTAIMDFTHFVVYTKTSLVEQTTPVAHLLYDAFASVSDITFADKDLDSSDLGGSLAAF